jgi:ATP-dependent Lon protease
MKESAQIAFNHVKSHIKKLGGDNKRLFDDLIHIHVPEGATPKDGPSAGIAIATALLSMSKNQIVPRQIAMTGEITLTGQVLAIGGVREKVIAARRVGIRELFLPEANRKDYEEVPDYIREGFTVHFVKKFSQVAKLVFD